MAQMLMQLIIAVGIVIYNFFIVRAGRKRDGSVYALTGRIDYFIITPMLAIATRVA